MAPIPDIHAADNPSASLSGCAGSANVRSTGWGGVGGACQYIVVGCWRQDGSLKGGSVWVGGE